MSQSQNTQILPIELKRLGLDGLEICWSDGLRSRIPAKVLRQNCPCAACRENRGETKHDQPISLKKGSLLRVIESSVEEECNLVELWPVGNYAIGLRWADGHSTGIYIYDLLRKLADNTRGFNI